jgi:hypothetical protein
VKKGDFLMAKVVLNPALQVLSGDIAGFEYRQQSDGSVVVAKKKLLDPNRELSEAQMEQMQKFKEASARYRRLVEDNDTLTAYQTLMEERGFSRLRAMVIGDILKSPVISTLDLTNYHGAAGDIIRVIAEDSVGVARVSLSIYDVTGDSEMESAEMNIQKVTGTVEWVFTATQSLPAGHEAAVHVTAYDLAGNKIENSASPS